MPFFHKKFANRPHRRPPEMALVAAGSPAQSPVGPARGIPAYEERTLPRTATSWARRDSGREARRSAPRPAFTPIHVLPHRPNNPAHVNGYLPRIHPSDERVIQRAITLVQGKWRIAILCQLQDGSLRVGELRRRMRPISKKVLNQHLRNMEKDGLVVRTEVKGKIPHVEYALTNVLGCSVVRLLHTVAQCGFRNAPSTSDG